MTTIWIIVALLAAALVMLALEIVTPSFGALAGLGIAAVIAAIWLGFTLSDVLGVVLIVAGLVGVPLYLVALVKIVPNTRFGRGLFLRRADPNAGGDGTPDMSAYVTLVGKTGTAETTLRPSGAVRVEGRRVAASAESGMIEKGSQVKIISATGMNVVVRKAT